MMLPIHIADDSSVSSPSDSGLPPLGRQKKWATKVRTGCLTCRLVGRCLVFFDAGRKGYQRYDTTNTLNQSPDLEESNATRQNLTVNDVHRLSENAKATQLNNLRGNGSHSLSL